jgi:dihydroorotate dehydrogenase (fumarate)
MSADLSTRYLGLPLRNPLVVSACPLSGHLESLRRLEASGIAAAVLPSLFEEQIEHEQMELHRLYEFQTESYAESLTHFPEIDVPSRGPHDYLKQVEAAKKAVSIPIIGSLNGASTGGWVRYARWIEEAGADALELNVYFVPTDICLPGSQVEQKYVDLVAAVRESVSVPLAVKIGPYFSSLPDVARRLADAGADGLVLFNRYLEPDIDLESLHFHPDLIYSQRHELRLPLRWIAILRDQLSISLAATSGIHQGEDVIKAVLAGADATMMAAALMRRGTDWPLTVLETVARWLEENEYQSIEQLQGSMSHANCPDPSALERANYMQALTRFTAQYSAVYFPKEP